jgi:hypothetical protein
MHNLTEHLGLGTGTILEDHGLSDGLRIPNLTNFVISSDICFSYDTGILWELLQIGCSLIKFISCLPILLRVNLEISVWNRFSYFLHKLVSRVVLFTILNLLPVHFLS